MFRKLPFILSSQIERSVYNKRRRKLFAELEMLRSKLAYKFNPDENYFIVDSMPLEVYKIATASRSNICKEEPYSSLNGEYCVSQNSRYYGYKLHMVCSVKEVIESLDITPVPVHDINYIKEIKDQLKNSTLIAYKGYLSSK